VPIRFTPEASKFANEECGGVNVLITDRRAFRPVRMGLEIAHQLRRLYPHDWKAEDYLRLLGNDAVHQALLAGKTPADMKTAYSEGLQEFGQRRQRFLLYAE
jgi:uncharacterized protein YbbC (DUF1343 family)